MTAALVLNELSFEGWVADDRETSMAIRGLAEVLRSVLSESGQMYLLANQRMSEVVFGGGVPLRRFAGHADTRDAALAIMGFASRSPLSGQDIDIDNCEARYKGRQAIGMLYCCLMDSILVSFPTHPDWLQDELRVELSRAIDNGGNVDIVSDVRQIPNIGCEANVTAHRVRLRPPRKVWADGNELWESRAVFTRLTFLDRVETQVRSLPHGSEELRQVADRLQELQEAAEEWREGPTPAWKSFVTGEGEARKRLATFTDQDGVDQCYHFHARFTPGAGRIHFKVVAEARSVEVAHIGQKL